MQNKIKVLWLAPYPISQVPGVKFSKSHNFHPATWIVNLGEELSTNKEIELHILTENPKITEDQNIFYKNIWFHLVKSSVPFTNKGYPSFLPIHKLTYYYFNSYKINKKIKSIAPDIVHAHGTETSYAITALRSKCKCIISIQGIINEISKFDNHFSNKIQSLIELKVIRLNKHFACRTDFDKSFVRENNSSAVVHHLDEAINKAFFDEGWICDDKSNILFVGSVSKLKGINILLEALAICKQKISKIILNLIGSVNEDYYKTLEKFIINNGLNENVNFLGTQPTEVIRKELNKAQIFVLPTLMDNSPNSLAEAMAVGTPSIASDVGGIPSMIENKFNGYLVKSNDPEALAEMMFYLLNNSSERKRISVNAKTTALNRNLPGNVANEAINIYKSILNDSR